MAGYLGTKAAFLSTTAASVTGNCTVGGNFTVKGGDVTFYEDTGTTPKFFWDASAESLGIGTSSPSAPLHINGGSANVVLKATNSSNTTGLFVGARDGAFGSIFSAGDGYIYQGNGKNLSMTADGGGVVRFGTGSTERMRIDSSGNLLVGTTSSPSSGTKEGIKVFDGGAVGDSRSGVYFGLGGVIPCVDLALADNSRDLGATSYRWADIYATNGTIQTSDRNEKQDIDVLNAAETAVAQACKGLLRKFRWKDAVAEKGDDARIHFGIIAQDLQDAFTAEGLDAGRYAMFISSTWWETQTDVPAVEAVEAVEATYDEDGNELTPAVEAVEAQEAYTRTDTYETLEEAPEGATERTRLGVRYPELLAFIIGAM